MPVAFVFAHMYKMADKAVTQKVAKILSSNESKFKTVEVTKEVDPTLDLGNLLLNDHQPVDCKEIKYVYKASFITLFLKFKILAS